MTQADNIRPYAIGVKYKILRDDVGIVPYVIYIINCSQNSNLPDCFNLSHHHKDTFAICFLFGTVMVKCHKSF